MPAYALAYIDDFSVVAGDGCDLAFLSDDVEGDGEGAIHLLIEVSVVGEIRSLEKVLHLDG